MQARVRSNKLERLQKVHCIKGHNMWFAGWIEVVLFNLKNKHSLDPNPFPYLCSLYQQKFKVFKTFSVVIAPFPHPPFSPLPIPLGTALVKIKWLNSVLSSHVCLCTCRLCTCRLCTCPLCTCPLCTCLPCTTWFLGPVKAVGHALILETLSAVGVYDTTFFWICSYLIGFFGFSSAWHLHVGVCQVLSWAFCVLHLYSSTEWGHWPICLWTFPALCLCVLLSPQNFRLAQLSPYLRSPHWCSVGISRTYSHSFIPKPTAPSDFSIAIKSYHCQAGVQDTLKWQVFFVY